MKNYFLILVSIALFSCDAHKKPREFAEFPLEVPEQNSLLAQWQKKTVFDSLMIDDMEHDTGWEVSGIGEMSYTTDRAKIGERSLRFRTSLRDTAHYLLPQNRTPWGSFDGSQGGHTALSMNYTTPQDWSSFNRISFWVYVHPASMPTYHFRLSTANQGTVSNVPIPGRGHVIQDLKPGMWNHVLFEMPHLERDSVTQFSFSMTLIGHHPEEEGIVTYDIDKLELQRVETDQYEGWTVSPEKFAFSHAGYRPGDSKIAMVGSGAGDSFQLIDQKDNVVFKGNVRVIENKNGLFRHLDFSEFTTEGVYRIRCGSLESNPFPINGDIWTDPVFKALNAFYCLRCGYHVPGIHLECHKDAQGFHGDVVKIINGGWHDAGDLSQGFWRTAMATFAMMRALEALQERSDLSNLADRIRTEIAWGLEWLLKTRFGDGYHISWNRMRIYTDNKVGTIDDYVTPARNVPWENFLAAAVFGKAAGIIEKSHPELAGQARIAAIEDWQAAVASRDTWDQAEYREAAWGVTSSILLAEMTGEEKYNEQAIKFGSLLKQCQEQNFLDGIPITGYFYTNTNRQRVIHNSHQAFEEAPLIALSMLCNKFPEHESWIDWYSAVVLHSEFFMKRGSQIAAPYYLLPNSVWKRSEIISETNDQLREDMLRQFNDGTPLNEEYMLRTFPIWIRLRGSTSIQMSSSWALAEASRLRNDAGGMQLVGKQLEWVFGANPFGQSLMYGVGYDFAPQFAYCLKNIVGSLPVGMDCISGDEPYWSASNYATAKELWVEPASRFLGAVSAYASHDQLIANKKLQERGINIVTKTIQSDGGIVEIMITITGKARHEVEIKTFNAEVNFERLQIDLSGNKSEVIELEMNVIDMNKPYIAVIFIDKNPDLRKEIVGSYIDASVLAMD